MAADRITVSLRLSEEAHRGLKRVCHGAGITMTALMEAVGLELDTNPRALADRGPDILAAARKIDQERLNRR